MKKSDTKKQVKIFGYALVAVLVFAVIEISSYLALNMGIPLVRSLVYLEPEVTRDEIDEYLSIRHPVLGWPTSDWLAARADASGARKSPANDSLPPTPVCVALYGDSFTYSDEVDDEHAWGNRLAKLLSCRVENFGIGGYGTDQAVLRFEQNGPRHARYVLLSIYPDNINRMNNQWRYLLSGANTFSFKPTIAPSGSGQPVAVPIVEADPDRVYAVIEDPAAHLEYEAYLPDGDGIKSRIAASFPYSYTFLSVAGKALGQIRFGKLMDGARLNNLNYPAWYDTGSGMSEQRVSRIKSVLDYFSLLCRKSGTRCGVMLIPDVEFVDTVIEGKPHGLEIIETLVPDGVDYFDVTAYLAERAGEKGLCSYIGQARDCNGHFNEEGYQVVADFVYRELAGQNAAN